MDRRSTEFYNRLTKSWLQDNDIEIYSTHKEGKTVVTERSIRTLRIKFINIWLQHQNKRVLIN